MDNIHFPELALKLRYLPFLGVFGNPTRERGSASVKLSLCARPEVALLWEAPREQGRMDVHTASLTRRVTRKAGLAISMVLLLAASVSASASTDREEVTHNGASQSASSIVTSGPVTLKVTADKQVAHVADPIELVIQVDAPRGTQVKMPAIGESLGPFEVRSTTKVIDIPIGEQLASRRSQRQITLETISTGQLTIPSLEIHYAPRPTRTGEALKFHTVRSKPLVIRVASVLEDRADPRIFRDIKDVVDIPLPPHANRTWIWWTVGAVGSLVTVAAVAALVLKRKTASPADWALAEIAKLEQSDLLQTDDAGALYGELADIAREFIEWQLGVAARACTTEEFLTSATESEMFQSIDGRHLEAFLFNSDDVKFARLQLGPDHLRDAMHHVKAFIMECESVRATAGKESS